MKFGFRTPSLKKKFAARTSFKRYVRHSLGVKAPKGMGTLTNPRKALYNRVYRRTTFGMEDIAKSHKRKSVASSNGLPKKSNGFFRWLFCLLLPPLAVIDQGFKRFLLVTLLTLLGWIPGVIAAFIILHKRR